jgi:hypothetical protein
MAGGAYDSGQTISLDHDPNQELQQSIAASRKQARAALAGLTSKNDQSMLTLIQSLIGPTSIDTMFEDFQTWITQTWQPIQDLYDNFEGAVEDFLSTFNFSLGSLTPTQPNLQVAPEFNSAYNVAINNRWSYDPLVGDPDAGSFKLSVNGKEQAVTGTPIQVSPGQKVDFKIKFKWTGLVYTGDPLQLRVREINSGNTVYLSSVNSPGTNGGWVEVAGTYTTPSSGVTSIKMRPTVLASATAGSVWIDHGQARKNGLIQQDWVQDLTDDLQAMVEQAQANLDKINEVFLAFAGSTTPGTFQDAVGKLLDLLGIVHPDDLDTLDQEAFWTAIWNSFLYPTGLIPSAEDLAAANARQARMAENMLILADLMHWYYPEGSSTDTPTTTIGGKRTWWAASNDVNNVKIEAGRPGATPAAALSAPLQVPIKVQAVKDAVTSGATGNTVVNATEADTTAAVDGLRGSVIDLSNTVSQLIVGNDTRPRLQADFSTNTAVGSNDWGPGWTESGTGTSHCANSTLISEMVTIGQYVRGIHSFTTPGDHQKVSMTLSSMINSAGRNTAVCRWKDWNNYVFARWAYNAVEIGQLVAGVETVWKTQTVSTRIGAPLTIEADDNYLFTVSQGNDFITSYNDAAHTSGKGALYRQTGLILFCGNFSGFASAPGNVTFFEASDGSLPAVVGTGARFYRNASTGSASAVTTSLPNNYWDTKEYMSDDITWNGVHFTVSKAGMYMMKHEIHVHGSGSFNGPAYATGLVQGVQQGNSLFTTHSGLRILSGSALYNCQAGDTLEPGCAFASPGATVGRITGFNPPEVVIAKLG